MLWASISFASCKRRLWKIPFIIQDVWKILIVLSLSKNHTTCWFTAVLLDRIRFLHLQSSLNQIKIVNSFTKISTGFLCSFFNRSVMWKRFHKKETFLIRLKYRFFFAFLSFFFSFPKKKNPGWFLFSRIYPCTLVNIS